MNTNRILYKSNILKRFCTLSNNISYFTKCGFHINDAYNQFDLTIAASLNYKDPFVVPLGKEPLVALKKQKLSQGEKGDHFVISEAIRLWEEADRDGEGNDFAWEHFLSTHTLRLLQDMKVQFAGHLHDMNYLSSSNPKDPKSNVNSDNIGLIKAIICSGLYPNVAMIKKSNKRLALKTVDHPRVELHIKSMCEKIRAFESPFLVYHMKLKSSAIFIHDATMVYPMALLFFGEKVDIIEDEANHSIRVDKMIKFSCFKKTAVLVKRLRTHLDSILENNITNPEIIDWTTHNRDEVILRAIVELITTENEEMMEYD